MHVFYVSVFAIIQVHILLCLLFLMQLCAYDSYGPLNLYSSIPLKLRQFAFYKHIYMCFFRLVN